MACHSPDDARLGRCCRFLFCCELAFPRQSSSNSSITRLSPCALLPRHGPGLKRGRELLAG
jgi:hypothetical protein